ncbi:hypothetical protein CWATWH0005_4402 [Crocosphaera watsonii WH 0005]|uniref:Uncharacterized protein n=1 Tax=Crocosphaera watsonii WH 0005 TaxID=423472 RepID=T2IR32_CROWT|nr:hypothetical protein CWATWH0005_4402 [Crocosphaera watsonii WH 0005]
MLCRVVSVLCSRNISKIGVRSSEFGVRSSELVIKCTS